MLQGNDCWWCDWASVQTWKQHTMMLFGTYSDLPEGLQVLFIWSAVQSTQGFLYCRQHTSQLCTEGILQLEVIWDACGTLLKECADTSHKVHRDLGNIIQVLTHSCLNATYCNYSHHHKGKTLQVWVWKKCYLITCTHTHAQSLTNDSNGEDHPASAVSLHCSRD